jgi:release factor glutamine methyltransferase
LTLHDALADARTRLTGVGLRADEVAIDVDVYACTILGWDRARLLADLRQPRPAALEPRFSEWVARREQREPTPYIVGVREFWGLEFEVSPAVLIPRPESELIVEEALRVLGSQEGARIADAGTGSGCLAIAIVCESASASVVATDISGDALEVAALNARRHSVDSRVRFVHTSYLDDVDGPFDLIVANPPYVKDGDKPALSRQVAGYEPHVALFGGGDGLRGVTAVLEAGASKLVPGGWLVVEFGLGQDDQVQALIDDEPALRLDRLRQDLQGIARTAVARRV